MTEGWRIVLTFDLVLCEAQGRSLLARFAEVAAAVTDAAQAHALCERFKWTDFVPGDGAAMARLTRRWGTAWMQALLQAWTARTMTWRLSEWKDKPGEGAAPWPRSLADFVRKGEDAGLEADAVDVILDRCLAALVAADRSFATRSPAFRHATLERRLRSVGDLAAALQRAAVIQALRQALDEPVLPPGNSSLYDIEWTCRCKDCGQVVAWAESASAQPLALSMAETRRQHVQSQLQETGAALDAETLKQGSPYKLVLRKPVDLADRRSAQRRAWSNDLAALDTHPRPQTC